MPKKRNYYAVQYKHGMKTTEGEPPNVKYALDLYKFENRIKRDEWLNQGVSYQTVNKPFRRAIESLDLKYNVLMPDASEAVEVVI